MSKRRHQRFVRRLETEFSAEGKKYRAISSDLSEGGLFIRTNHAFAPGTIVDILIFLPDGNSSRLKGKVRRALKTPVVSLKNGMGIELVEKDSNYNRFILTFTCDGDEQAGPSAALEAKETIRETQKPEDFLIIACSICNVKNKVKRSKMAACPRCGKCGHSLVIQA